jgi:hypothetical protein
MVAPGACIGTLNRRTWRGTSSRFRGLYDQKTSAISFPDHERST